MNVPKGVFLDESADSDWVDVSVPDPEQRRDVLAKLFEAAETRWDVQPDTSGESVSYKVPKRIAVKAGLYGKQPRRKRTP